MTLTHEQIAGMTCGQVNKEIAKRLDQYEEWDSMGSDNMDCPDVFEEYPDYCHDWSHSGRLLEMMAKTRPPETYTPSLGCDRHGVWDCYAYISENKRDDPVSQEAPTAPEAIARCWLEWWEVTHTPASSGA